MQLVGTTGRPIDISVPAAEYESRVMRCRRSLQECNVGPGVRVLQLLSLNDMFTLGPLFWLVTMSEGACAIRCDVNRVDRILQVIEDARPDVVIGNAYIVVLPLP